VDFRAYLHTHYFRNLGPRFVMNVVSKLAGLIITLYLARVLGPTQLGYFSFVAAVASTLAMVFSFGIPGYIQNHVPALLVRGKEREAKELLGTAYNALVVLSILAFVSAFLGGFVAQAYFHRTSGLFLFVLAGVYAVVYLFMAFGSAVLTALHRLYLALRASIVKDAARLLLVLVAVYIYRTYLSVILVYIAVFGVYAYYLLRILRPWFADRRSPGLLRGALPYLFFGLASTLLAYTDVLMLSYFRPMSDVGYYKIAQLVVTATIAILPIVAVSLPTLSRAAASGQLRRKFLQLILFAISVAVAADVFLYFLGPPLILFFVGQKYLASVPILYALLPIIPFYFVYALGVQAIIALGREKEQVVYPLLAGSFNVVLNYFLIQEYGTVGAAIAASASMGIAALLVLGRLLMIKHASQRAS